MQNMDAGIGNLVRRATPEALRPAARRVLQLARTNYDRYVYERPSGGLRKRMAMDAATPDFLEKAEVLCRDGIVIFPSYFGGDELASMQEEFERLIQSNPPDEEAAKTNAIHIATGRLADSLLLSRLAFHAEILRYAQYYWGKQVVLIGTGGTRIEPFDSEDYGSYQWHHDAKRKQFRAMILLTDVPVGGQHMRYMSGTHNKFRSDHEILNSRITPDEAAAHGKEVACAGPAGTLVLFDTNGTHRGNRNLGPRRDHWQFTYRAPGRSALQDRRPVPLHPEILSGLTPEQRQIARCS